MSLMCDVYVYHLNLLQQAVLVLYFEILVHFRNHFYSLYKNENILKFCSVVQVLQILLLHLHAVLGKIGSLSGVLGVFWIYQCGSNREW